MNHFDMAGGNRGNWLALMIGNSNLHWAWFENALLRQSWDTPHLSVEQVNCLIQNRFNFKDCWNQCRFAWDKEINFSFDRPSLSPIPSDPIPVWIASVVPAQTQLWQSYVGTHCLTLTDIPLRGLYSTLGIDRALSLWGAAYTLGLPALVIDAGTALTFTGADAAGQLVGGAILPGLGLQIRSLTQHTAALPEINDRLNKLAAMPPARWAKNTPDAMLSGVLYTLLAGIVDFVEAWLQAYPDSSIVVTGGDRDLLFQCGQRQYPERFRSMKVDPQLIFWGMAAAVAATSDMLSESPVSESPPYRNRIEPTGGND